MTARPHLRLRKTFPLIAFLTVWLINTLSADAAKIHPKRIVTKNGMTLLIVEQHSLPIVNIEVLVRAGSIYDSETKAGLANLTASLLDEGTRKRSSAEIAETIDFVGGSLSTSGGDDYSTVSVRLLKKDLPLGLDLLADVLINPVFSQKELDRKRAETIGMILAEQDEPGIVAEKALNDLIFSPHPYHRPVKGLQSTLPTITRADLIDFHARYYRPNNIIMAIVGDTTEPEILDLVSKYFGTWEQKKIKPPAISRSHKLDHKTVRLINKDLSQASIVLGHLGIDRKNPDYYAVVVMNYILGGGGFSSRMMARIRDDQGLAYSVGSHFDAGLFPGSFQASLQTKNVSAKPAIQGLVDEIKNIRENPVTSQELEDAKAFLIGNFPLRLDTSSKMSRLLATIEFYGLGLDYFEKYPRLIGAVSKDDILRVAKKYLDPQRYVLVVVANQSEAKINDLKP
jgi:zinc protease